MFFVVESITCQMSQKRVTLVPPLCADTLPDPPFYTTGFVEAPPEFVTGRSAVEIQVLITGGQGAHPLTQIRPVGQTKIPEVDP